MSMTNHAANIPGGAATAGRAGADAEIWRTYVSEAAEYDKTLIASWNEDLDTLLIFVCLKSSCHLCAGVDAFTGWSLLCNPHSVHH
jgi:hypothetical protein